MSKETKSAVIHVAFCINNEYTMCTGVAAYSLCKNKDPDDELVIHIVTIDQLSDSNKEKFQLLGKIFSNIRIQIYDDTNTLCQIDSVLSNLYELPKKMTKEANKSICVRLLLDRILSGAISKVISLDGDILVFHSLRNLWDRLPQKPYLIGAVSEGWVAGPKLSFRTDCLAHYMNNLRSYEPNLEVSSYFRGGMFLMDIASMRAESIADKLIEWICTRKPMYPEQDAINVLLRGRILECEPMYNAAFIRSKPYVPIAPEIVIGHYGGHPKPWEYSPPFRDWEWRFCETWLQYRRESPWGGINEKIVPPLVWRAPSIPNNMGGDFKRYLLENDMPLRLRELKSGLDDISLAVVNRVMEFILNFPNAGTVFADKFLCKHPDDVLNQEELKILHLEKVEKKLLHAQGAIGGVDVLVYDHGLKELSIKALSYIKGKSFVDAGGWNGDSALMLKKYKPSKIFSFEMSPIFLQKLLANTANYRELIEVVPCALFSRNDSLSFSDKNATGGLSLLFPGETQVKTITLDSFYGEKKDETLGLLKANIEGAEMELLKGARQIITRDRPVMSLCIYHNPEQFFELKPMLESWELNYKFMIRRLLMGTSFAETTLIAYPKEL